MPGMQVQKCAALGVLWGRQMVPARMHNNAGAQEGQAGSQACSPGSG